MDFIDGVNFLHYFVSVKTEVIGFVFIFGVSKFVIFGLKLVFYS